MARVLWKLAFVFALLLLLIPLTVISLHEKQKPGILLSQERPSPGDWVKEEQIKIYSDKVVLDIDNPLWAIFTNTNSMDPFLDETSHAIEIQPLSPDDISLGDVISYKMGENIVIHRIVEIGEDAQGAYYVVQGDNNSSRDPTMVRFNDVTGVVVAVIY
ncbi:hypothetical protein J4228_02570 [Candidatus Woesearchaeota archaeon]|nr:hypothetical protein [Candidatus Woesearchaeota archaeon]